MPSTPAMSQIWLQVASTAAHYVLVHPPGSVEEGFLETMLFLEPKFVMESTHPTLLNIGTELSKVSQRKNLGPALLLGNSLQSLGRHFLLICGFPSLL